MIKKIESEISKNDMELFMKIHDFPLKNKIEVPDSESKNINLALNQLKEDLLENLSEENAKIFSILYLDLIFKCENLSKVWSQFQIFILDNKIQYDLKYNICNDILNDIHKEIKNKNWIKMRELSATLYLATADASIDDNSSNSKEEAHATATAYHAVIRFSKNSKDFTHAQHIVKEKSYKAQAEKLIELLKENE